MQDASQKAPEKVPTMVKMCVRLFLHDLLHPGSDAPTKNAEVYHNAPGLGEELGLLPACETSRAQ